MKDFLENKSKFNCVSDWMNTTNLDTIWNGSNNLFGKGEDSRVLLYTR